VSSVLDGTYFVDRITGLASGGYVSGTGKKTVTYLDAYEGDEKRNAAIRVLEDGIKNRSFAQKAYTQLDFSEAVAYLLLEVLNKEENKND